MILLLINSVPVDMTLISKPCISNCIITAYHYENSISIEGACVHEYYVFPVMVKHPSKKGNVGNQCRRHFILQTALAALGFTSCLFQDFPQEGAESIYVRPSKYPVSPRLRLLDGK